MVTSETKKNLDNIDIGEKNPLRTLPIMSLKDPKLQQIPKIPEVEPLSQQDANPGKIYYYSKI